jgi:hypothetical protein
VGQLILAASRLSGGYGPTEPPTMSLKSLIEQRRAFLLSYPGIK